MADFIKNKINLDPNNEQAISDLRKNQFFFSVNSTERDQWGNANLMHMSYGPGSSIKPTVLAAVASQANAGWENLILLGSNMFTQKNKEKRPTVYQYGGLKLPSHMGWNEMHSGENSTTDIHDYISQSSNLYNSLIVFLGSYPKNAFEKDSILSIKNVMTKDNQNGLNAYPVMSFNGGTYHFLPYNSKKWPKAENKKNTYFGNENSLLANGLNYNMGIIVDDENKNDRILKSLLKINFTNNNYFDTLDNQIVGAAVWSFPEPSYFLQAERENKDKISNFMNGLKNPTLGGAPWYITPLKVAEMYGSMASQNNLYNLHITPKNKRSQSWNTDNSWNNTFPNFLQSTIFEGMKRVLTTGTARDLKAALGANENIYNGFHLYAKTGTIGEGGFVDSKRLALIISKNDLITTNFINNKFYVVYIMANEIDNADISTYKYIIDQILNSKSFKIYMQ